MPKISKSKNLSAGVTKTTKKAPNKEGAFISVQNRTLGNMKKGGKVKKAQTGIKERYATSLTTPKKKIQRIEREGNPNNPPLQGTISKIRKNAEPELRARVSMDTTGYAGGKKQFPMTTTSKSGNVTKGVANRKDVESTIKNPNKATTTTGYRKGGFVKKSMKSGGKMSKKK